LAGAATTTTVLAGADAITGVTIYFGVSIFFAGVATTVAVLAATGAGITYF